MARKDLPLISRRLLLAASLAPAAAWAAPARPKIITMLGDSITAGLGLARADALPAQLQAALTRLGVAVTVRGAGVSGDTSAAGLARTDFSVQSDTNLCIVALGGNDLLQGLDVRQTRANLTAIVRKLKARRIGVLITGQKAPRAIGAAFARDFDASFAQVAAAEHVALYPNLLDGVGQIPSLNQRDGIHPNAAGVKIIAARLAPVAARVLRTGR
ncbi:MAG: arylesterase [Caulobacteraceae bacterium]